MYQRLLKIDHFGGSSIAVITLLCLFIFLSQHAFSQQYYFRHYQVEQGLSHNTVFSSLQGKNGFLWFGTKEGLNRFDGYNFKLFLTPVTSRNEINNNYIYSLSKDEKGQIWVGAQNGLYRIDETKETLVPVTNAIRNIYKVIQAKNNKYWILAQHSVYLYDTISRKLVTVAADQQVLATALAKTQDGTIWIGDEEGKILRFNPSDSIFRLYSVKNNTSSGILKRINKLVPVNGNNLFICTAGQGIKKLNTEDRSLSSIITYNEDKTPIFARDIIQESSNQYWFATESGIFIYDSETSKIINLKKTFLDPYSLSDNAVYNLTKDNEGGIWAGTFFGGINYFPKQYNYFHKYYPGSSEPSISGTSVREIREDKDHQIWLGTEDGGLNKLDPETGNIIHFKPTGKKGDISYSNIHGLLIDDNSVWIGTFEHGLDIMNRKTGKVIRHYDAGSGEYDLKSNFVLSIIKHSSGIIYLGTANGLYRYRSGTEDFEMVREIPHNIFISILQEDHSGTIWAGTHGNGLYYYNPGSGEAAQYADKSKKQIPLSHIFVNDIYEDSRQRIWIASEGGGLISLNKDHKIDSIYNKLNGFPSNHIFKSLEDKNGILWVTTSKGLVQLNRVTSKIQVFTKETGLLNNQFNYSSGWRDHKGTIYFGSIKGMIRFNPDSFEENRFSLPIYITGIQIHNNEINIENTGGILNKSILYTEEITLPFDQSSISLDVAALSYTSPEVTQYSYILEGLDNQWTVLEKNRKIYYTNLAPGSYLFKVKANAFNENRSDTRTLRIKILPPFWATQVAYLTYFIALGSLISFLIITYHNRTQNKKEKEIYEAKIDFFTNVAHEIKTPLTLIKGPVENLQEVTDEFPAIRKDVSMLERNTNRLVALVQQILDFRQTETKGFKLYFTDLSISELLKHVYEDFIPLASKKKLIFTWIDSENDLIVKADEDALEKIFSNLISNAIKYANKNVLIELKATDVNYWQLIIMNDGKLIPEELREKIFEPFYRINEPGKQKGTGIGLALSRSLAELHNGTIKCTSMNGMNTFILSIPKQL